MYFAMRKRLLRRPALRLLACFLLLLTFSAPSAVMGAGAVTEFPVPTANSGPAEIITGPDGNLWFTERNTTNIGRITPAGVITEFPPPDPGSLEARDEDGGITAGPDGNLWFIEGNSDVFGWGFARMTPAGVITGRFPIPPQGWYHFSPGSALTAGPDGNLWFTEGGGGRGLGRISPNDPNPIVEFTISGGNITNGPDGNLWFTQLQQSIWRLATADCDKCVAAKLKAIGKKESSKLACLARVAQTGDSSGLSDCNARAESKYDLAFAKAGECGSSEAACESSVDSCVSQVAANLPDVSSRCEAAKLKAAAKAVTGLFNCSARSASRGKPADPDCAILLPGTKIQDKLTAALMKADASGPCSGDPSTLGIVIELACHVLIPVVDSAETVAGLACF